MGINWLERLGFSRRQKKPFAAWQIELTTRCPLRCRMCIRDKAEDWHGADMSIDDFKRLIPYMKDVETVVLEGWGESLLHSHLIEAIRLVKAEGSQVGFVTGGFGLNEEYITELIDAGVDFMGFSFAGAAEWTHNSIRVNSDFKLLIDAVLTINEIKKEKNLNTPRVHIVYLMLRENIFEVPLMVGIAKAIGIEEVVLTNLIHVTNRWQEEQRVFTCTDKEGYRDVMKETEMKAKESKITLRLPSLSPKHVPVCEENPLRNLYISIEGEVSPCVYLYPPLPSPFKRIFCENEYHIEKVSFGNIFREPFHTIWNTKKYSEFRKCFMLRGRRFEEIYSYHWEIERLKRMRTSPLSDPPEQCKTCHKILGV